MSSTISPMRPASAREVSCRWRPRISCLRRIRGITTTLDQEEADGDQPEREVLDQDEHDRRQDLSTEEHRLNEGIADEAAERLHLVLDHGGDFGALDPAELRRRKAQDTVDQLVAQLTEHTLAEPALVEVDIIFEEAVDDHQEQEGGRQHDERPDRSRSNPLQQSMKPSAFTAPGTGTLIWK